MTPQDPKRRRGVEATSAAIVQAAAELFSKHGYDGTSTRQIAQYAGVNVALINRYFGSKAGLFEAAVLPMLTLQGLLDGGMEDFGARVAGFYFGPLPDKTADPILAVLRSTGNPDVADTLRDTLRRNFLEALADKLAGPDAETRAALIIMEIAGVDLMVRVLRVLPDEQEKREAIRGRLAQNIQSLVDR